jgi:hypothetical protein
VHCCHQRRRLARVHLRQQQQGIQGSQSGLALFGKPFYTSRAAQCFDKCTHNLVRAHVGCSAHGTAADKQQVK